MESGKKKGNYYTAGSFSPKVWKKRISNVFHETGERDYLTCGECRGSGKYPGKRKRATGSRCFHTRLPPQWLVRNMTVGFLFSAGAAFLFYRSVWAVSVGIVLIPLYIMRSREKWMKARKQQLQRQFISGMQIVSASLAAGYSMENAWRNAGQDLNRLYGPDAEFCVEMHKMNQRLSMNEQLEQVLFDFASDSNVEDIYNFAEIFCYVKRCGGNRAEIIRTTIDRMQQKADILAEIENAVASKKMEQRMMNLLLPGVLLFITISSPSYVSVLYHNALGVLVMSICLAGYIFCFWWSERLTDIVV